MQWVKFHVFAKKLWQSEKIVKYVNEFRQLTNLDQSIASETVDCNVKICELRNRINQRTVEIDC